MKAFYYVKGHGRTHAEIKTYRRTLSAGITLCHPWTQKGLFLQPISFYHQFLNTKRKSSHLSLVEAIRRHFLGVSMDSLCHSSTSQTLSKDSALCFTRPLSMSPAAGRSTARKLQHLTDIILHHCPPNMHIGMDV